MLGVDLSVSEKRGIGNRCYAVVVVFFRGQERERGNKNKRAMAVSRSVSREREKFALPLSLQGKQGNHLRVFVPAFCTIPWSVNIPFPPLTRVAESEVCRD